MPYMNGLQYSHPVQPRTKHNPMRKKRRMEQSTCGAGTSGVAGSSGVVSSTSVLRITDGSSGHVDIEEDDDDFEDPPPRWQDTSDIAKSPVTSPPSSHHFDNAEEPQPDVPPSVHIDINAEVTGEEPHSSQVNNFKKIVRVILS